MHAAVFLSRWAMQAAPHSMLLVRSYQGCKAHATTIRGHPPSAECLAYVAEMSQWVASRKQLGGPGSGIGASG